MEIKNLQEYTALVNRTGQPYTEEELAAIKAYQEKLRSAQEQPENKPLGSVTEDADVPPPPTNFHMGRNVNQTEPTRTIHVDPPMPKMSDPIEDIAKEMEASMANDDYDGEIADSSDMHLSPDNDFDIMADNPSVNPNDRVIDDLRDLPEEEDEKALEAKLLGEMKSEIEQKQAQNTQKAPENEPKKEESTLEVVVQTTEDQILEDKEAEDIKSNDLRSSDIDEISYDDGEINNIMETMTTELKEELSAERIEGKEEIEFITSESEGLTPEESKMLKALEAKREKFLQRVVTDKKYATYASYKNKYGEALKSYDIDNLFNEANVEQYQDPMDDSGMKALAKQIERTTISGNKTKIALPLSGINVVMRALSSADILGMLEKLKTPMIKLQSRRDTSATEKAYAYIEQKEIEIKMIFKHIEYVTNQEGKTIYPSEEEFLKMVRIPDLSQLYFALFDATYRDKNKYSLTCNKRYRAKDGNIRFCNTTFDYYAYNESLCYIPNKYITPEEFVALRNGFPEGKSAKDLEIVKVAEKVVRLVTSQRYILTFHIPTLWDYFNTLRALTNIFSKNELEEVDITRMDVLDSIYNTVEDMGYVDLYLKACLFLKSLKRPIVEKIEDKGKEKALIKYQQVDKKENILQFFTAFGLEDIRNIIKDEKFRALLRLRGIKHYISGAVCPTCGTHLDPTPIDIEDVFFSTTMESTSI